jgi:F-type H+-transporting ATPase subunit a
MSASLHISLSAEPIAYLGSFPITNSMFTSLIISGLIIAFAFFANRELKSTDKPNDLQNFSEFIVESFYHFCYSITGNMKRAQVFLPWIATFFIFIILNNWSGLIPGVGYIFVPEAEPARQTVEAVSQPAVTEVVTETEADEIDHEPAAKKVPLFRAGTADLNTTLALGLITVFMIQFFGFQYQGFAYLSKYFNFSSPINFFIGLLELLSETGKIVSFGFRLFGNIFAGEVLIGVLMFLTKAIVPVPFYGLELFIGMIQAVVFSMLSLVLYNMATIGHGEEH